MDATTSGRPSAEEPSISMRQQRAFTRQAINTNTPHRTPAVVPGKQAMASLQLLPPSFVMTLLLVWAFFRLSFVVIKEFKH